MIEEVIRGLGWASLKTLTGGRYKSAGSSAELFEGTLGLLVVAGIFGAMYSWWP
jgi:hypothetical protein